mgnify:CR=1 FL=1
MWDPCKNRGPAFTRTCISWECLSQNGDLVPQRARVCVRDAGVGSVREFVAQGWTSEASSLRRRHAACRVTRDAGLLRFGTVEGKFPFASRLASIIPLTHLIFYQYTDAEGVP